MMKKINILLFFTLVLLIGVNCRREKDNCHKTITFINKTEGTLYVTSAYEYPDTMVFRTEPNPILNPNFTKVLPKENNTQVLWSRDCIELAFKDLIPSDTLMIYVFAGQVLNTTPWDIVKANHLVLKRYDLSLEDLQKLDWTITYP